MAAESSWGQGTWRWQEEQWRKEMAATLTSSLTNRQACEPESQKPYSGYTVRRHCCCVRNQSSCVDHYQFSTSFTIKCADSRHRSSATDSNTLFSPSEAVGRSIFLAGSQDSCGCSLIDCTWTPAAAPSSVSLEAEQSCSERAGKGFRIF